MENNDEKIETLKKLKEEEIANREKRRKEYWENMEPFTEPYDVPSLPQVSKEEWENFYVPHLIRCGAIPKDQLEVGAAYYGDCRNASEAVWDGEKFTYQRYKFGFTFPEKINHFQDDDGYDLFVPIKKIEK